MITGRHAASGAGLVLAVLMLGGCGLTGPAHGPPSARARAAVTMGFTSYDPAMVTIRPGDTVEWQNTSLITHTVTDDATLAQKAGDSSLPPSAAPFNSGDIAPGQVYFHTFSVPGTYRYFCRHHEAEGMLGIVVVRAAS